MLLLLLVVATIVSLAFDWLAARCTKCSPLHDGRVLSLNRPRALVPLVYLLILSIRDPSVIHRIHRTPRYRSTCLSCLSITHALVSSFCIVVKRSLFLLLRIQGRARVHSTQRHTAHITVALLKLSCLSLDILHTRAPCEPREQPLKQS